MVPLAAGIPKPLPSNAMVPPLGLSPRCGLVPIPWTLQPRGPGLSHSPRLNPGSGCETGGDGRDCATAPRPVSVMLASAAEDYAVRSGSRACAHLDRAVGETG